LISERKQATTAMRSTKGCGDVLTNVSLDEERHMRAAASTAFIRRAAAQRAAENEFQHRPSLIG